MVWNPDHSSKWMKEKEISNQNLSFNLFSIHSKHNLKGLKVFFSRFKNPLRKRKSMKR
jgi:hypothetical protein